MWFLPSYGRPDCFDRLVNSPGKMPVDVIVVVNADDPYLDDYRRKSPWMVRCCPPGRFADAWRWVLKEYPQLPWYGMLGDDHIPQTPEWHTRMVEAAGLNFLSYPNGRNTEFPLMRGVCVLGGELVRQVGWIVPPGFLHNYIDVVLDQLARDAGLLVPIVDVFVDHLHWQFDESVIKDETYLRGSADQQDDCGRYIAWLCSPDRTVLNAKLMRWRQTWDASLTPSR